MKDCIFCKIINGEIPSKTIYEDEYVKVFLDVNPVSNGHMLIVPKKHKNDLNDIDDNLLIHINRIAKNMINLAYDKLDIDGVKLVNNYGSLQEVKHYHLHIIPANTKKENIIDDPNIIFEKLTK